MFSKVSLKLYFANESKCVEKKIKKREFVLQPFPYSPLKPLVIQHDKSNG